MLSFLERSIDFKSTWQVIKLSAYLPQILNVNNLSENIRKMKPLLNNTLLNTLKFKNVLGCLGE
jgi:hypothetical protein